MNDEKRNDIRVLSEEEFRREAEPALRAVFAGIDPFDEPFAAEVKGRRILFEYWYELEHSLLDAVVEASSELGESGFYVSILDRPKPEEQKDPFHWYVPFRVIERYRGLVGPLKNAVYSPKGIWGIMGSYEHHGLLGGTPGFVARVESSVPGLDEQVYGFLANWDYNRSNFDSAIDWLPRLLTHVYGDRRAAQLLEESGLGKRPLAGT